MHWCIISLTKRMGLSQTAIVCDSPFCRGRFHKHSGAKDKWAFRKAQRETGVLYLCGEQTANDGKTGEKECCI